MKNERSICATQCKEFSVGQFYQVAITFYVLFMFCVTMLISIFVQLKLIKMAHMVVVYNTPQDTAVFDKHYAEVHIPLCKKIPGLIKFELSQGPLLTPAGQADYYQVATLYFENMATLKAGIMESEAGKAAATDAQTNIGKPALMLFFDNKEV